MSLQTCSYQDCYIQRLPFSSVAFFRLPDDEPRRKQWIRNSGNKQLRNLKKHQKVFFCQNHFQTRDIKAQFNRKILRRNAVPQPYESDTNISEWEEVDEEITMEDETFTHNYKQIREDELISLSEDFCFIYDDESGSLGITEIAAEQAESMPAKHQLNALGYTQAETDATISEDGVDTAAEAVEAVPYTFSTPISCNILDAVAKDDSTLHSVNDDNASNGISNCNAVDKTYESDRHFALSLVYYFQRLNAKKKAKAKINILTYLVALEQDDGVQLEV